jgi:hypothetical protein
MDPQKSGCLFVISDCVHSNARQAELALVKAAKDLGHRVAVFALQGGELFEGFAALGPALNIQDSGDAAALGFAHHVRRNDHRTAVFLDVPACALAPNLAAMEFRVLGVFGEMREGNSSDLARDGLLQIAKFAEKIVFPDPAGRQAFFDSVPVRPGQCVVVPESWPRACAQFLAHEFLVQSSGDARAASQREPIDLAERDAIAEGLRVQLRARDADRFELESAIDERDEKIMNADELLFENNMRIGWLNGAVERVNRIAWDHYAQAEDRLARIVELEQILVSRRARIGELEAMLAASRAQVAAILSSHSWKLTRPLRVLRRLVAVRSFSEFREIAGQVRARTLAQFDEKLR